MDMYGFQRAQFVCEFKGVYHVMFPAAGRWFSVMTALFFARPVKIITVTAGNPHNRCMRQAKKRNPAHAGLLYPQSGKPYSTLTV
jgi:hypothetical protein